MLHLSGSVISPCFNMLFASHHHCYTVTLSHCHTVFLTVVSDYDMEFTFIMFICITHLFSIPFVLYLPLAKHTHARLNVPPTPPSSPRARTVESAGIVPSCEDEDYGCKFM